jgi:hypothetical protein
MHETHKKMNLYSTVYAGQNIPVKCMKVPIKHISCEISQKIYPFATYLIENLFLGTKISP